MRRFKLKFTGLIGFLAVLALFIGCGGDSDLFDEAPTRYSAQAIPKDGDDDTQEIDVFFNDCDGNLSTPDDVETNFPFDVKIIVEADDTAAKFRIEGYEVRFRRNHGDYFEVDDGDPQLGVWEDLTADEMPALTGTVLNPASYNYTSPIINPGDTLTIDGLLVWSQGDKIYYAQTVLGSFSLFLEDYVVVLDPGPPVVSITYSEAGTTDLVYDFQVILNCRTLEDQEFDITTPWTPVHFADFNKCS